ncbi:sulfite exporter TauE/SafE family protein [Terrihabitans sp. B22-R8]|uniref:sulfite exporter TauE/SafE family protein n=1 Tax=Terrihabitans sp. B22-R8 TaxID=3425128 RepID=UPI00403C02FA
MITDVGFYVVAIPAVILLGLGKGGFSGLGALSLPILALQISPLAGAAIMLPILMVQDVVTLWAYWGKWDWPNLRALFPGAVIGLFIAYLIAAYISDAMLQLTLGTICVIFGARHFLTAADAPPRPRSDAAGVFWGVLTGISSMIANNGGPPAQIYLTPQRLPREVYVGTMALLFTVVNWLKIPPFMALGQFSERSLTTSAVLMPLAIASAWAGVLLVRRTSPQHFYKVIYGLMVLVGLKLVWDGASAVLA